VKINGVGLESTTEPIASVETCQETGSGMPQQCISIDRNEIQS
jgi:hypothetical protein